MCSNTCTHRLSYSRGGTEAIGASRTDRIFGGIEKRIYAKVARSGERGEKYQPVTEEKEQKIGRVSHER